MRMQPQGQRSWWPAWNLDSLELVSSQDSATPQKASLQQQSHQAVHSNDGHSNTLDSQAGSVSSLLRELPKKFAMLQVASGNSAPQHLLGPSASTCNSPSSAIGTIAELLSLHAQSADKSAQPFNRQSDSSLQLEMQQIKLQHNNGPPQYAQNSAAAAGASPATAETVSSADATDIKQHSIHRHPKLHLNQLHGPTQDASSMFQHLRAPVSNLQEHEHLQQSLQQLPSCTRDISPGLQSAGSSVASNAEKTATAKEHNRKQIAPALRPYNVSLSNLSQVTSRNSNELCQNSSRAASIFEPDAQPIVDSNHRQPSAFNSALRAQFLSVVPDIGCRSSLQPASQQYSRMSAAPANAMYDLPFVQRNHDSKAHSVAGSRAHGVMPEAPSTRTVNGHEAPSTGLVST